MSEPTQDIMFCRVDGTNLRHFFPWQHGAEICSDVGYVARVVIIPDDNGTWWCWRSTADDRVHHVWPNLDLLDMCFPYGIKAEVERGRGKYFQARVKILGPA